MRKSDMISLTALMTLTKMIYSWLSEFVMRGESFFVLNITTIQLFAHSIRKLISIIFYVSDIWISYWFIIFFNCWNHCFKVGIQSASFLCTEIKYCHYFLRLKLRSKIFLIQQFFKMAVSKSVSRSTKLTMFSTSLNVNDMFFSFTRMM